MYLFVSKGTTVPISWRAEGVPRTSWYERQTKNLREKVMKECEELGSRIENTRGSESLFVDCEEKGAKDF